MSAHKQKMLDLALSSVSDAMAAMSLTDGENFEQEIVKLIDVAGELVKRGAKA